MTGPIFVFNPEGALVPIFEKPYESESIFQEMLTKYPELLLGGDERTPYSGLLLIAREQSIPLEEGGGYFSLDHLFVDQNGVPTLVEVKRRSDHRNRREVVAQMLDYASNGLASWSVDDLRHNFEKTCEVDGRDPAIVLGEFLGEEGDSEAFWRSIEVNMQNERIRMVFVADEISLELRRIISFLNRQMRTSEMLAIELKQFIGEGVQAFVPDVIVKPVIVPPPPPPPLKWTEDRFMTELEERAGQDAVGVARTILEWGNRSTSYIEYGRGSKDGALFPVFVWKGRKYYPVILWTYGRVEIQFTQLQTRPPFDDLEERRDFQGRLNAIPGVSIPEEALDKRPAFSMKGLVDEGAMKQFIDALDWIMTEITTKA